MRVREWIELLSEMDPEWEVCATREGDPTKTMFAVKPIEAQDTRGGPGPHQHNCAPFVRIVREDR